MRKAEIFFSSLAALTCLVISVALFFLITTQPLWPFPALYFIELAVLAVLAWLASLRDRNSSPGFIWFITGVFFGFVILSIWSVGFIYLPVALFLGVAATLSDGRHRINKLPLHLGIFLLGALMEAAFLFAVIQLILRSNY
jgi:hypothetical protein